jgi:hypothetical protein
MVLIIGDSHARVIALGQDELPASSPARDYDVRMLGIGRTFLRKFYTVGEDGVSLSSERRRDILRGAIGTDVIDQSVGDIFLSLGFHGIYFYNSSTWRNFRIVEREDDRSFISQSAFSLMVMRFNYHILAFISALKRAGLKPVVIAAPALPRSFIDNPRVGGVTPDELVALDAAYRDVMASILRKRRVPVILPPEGTSEDGCLKEEYRRSTEVHEYHGDASYGALVLAQVEAFLHEQAATAAAA